MLHLTVCTERVIVKAAFKTKDADKILSRKGEKITIDRNNMVKGDLVYVDGSVFMEDEVLHPNRIVEIIRKKKVISYMEL